MSNDPNKIKEIDEYLSGELTPELRDAFEKRLGEDADLREDFDATKQVIEGIQGYAFKKMLDKIHRQSDL